MHLGRMVEQRIWNSWKLLTCSLARGSSGWKLLAVDHGAPRIFALWHLPHMEFAPPQIVAAFGVPGQAGGRHLLRIAL